MGTAGHTRHQATAMVGRRARPVEGMAPSVVVAAMMMAEMLELEAPEEPFTEAMGAPEEPSTEAMGAPEESQEARMRGAPPVRRLPWKLVASAFDRHSVGSGKQGPPLISSGKSIASATK